MALPALGARQVALVAAFALLTAGAGTYATVQVLRGDSSARAAAAIQRAAAPVMSTLPAPLKAAPAKVGALAGELRGQVGPAGVRKIKKTLDVHNPARAVQRAAQAVSVAGAGVGSAGAAQGKAGGGSPRRGAWKRRAFGRGAILERR